MSNNKPATLPDGLDIEVFSFKTLHKGMEESNNKF